MGREKMIPEKVFYVCTGSSCKKSGGKEIAKHLRRLIKAEGLKEEIEVIKTDCTDRCKCSPIVSIQPDNVWITETTEEKINKVFNEMLRGETNSDSE